MTPKPYMEFASVLAMQAGTMARNNFVLAGMPKTWKADQSPLTVTDTCISDLVIQAVTSTYPHHGVISEEDDRNPNPNSPYQWVVDPIDGTSPFSHGTPLFTFSLALVIDGVAEIGVIHDPMMNRLLVAEKGHGATMMKAGSIYVSRATSLNNSLMSFEDSRLWPTVRLGNLRTRLKVQGAQVTEYHAFVYGGMLVATGNHAAALYASRYPWDVAALKVIVEAAGGRVTNFAGGDQRYDRALQGAIVSNGLVHNQLIDIVQEALVEHPQQ